MLQVIRHNEKEVESNISLVCQNSANGSNSEQNVVSGDRESLELVLYNIFKFVIERHEAKSQIKVTSRIIQTSLISQKLSCQFTWKQESKSSDPETIQF